MGRNRKYCARECRETVRLYLNRRTGLLRALNTRYATFYFTEWIVVMDLLPYGTEQIFSYILPRSPGCKPVFTFAELSDMLGSAWWAEHNRTNKRYIASRHVLEKARKSDASEDGVKPLELVLPNVRRSALITLNLKQTDLAEGNLKDSIKRAYRRMVKQHHPDLGGDSVSFRKIHEAYECLLEWARHPTFTRKAGFPDKWFYEGSNNRWIEPTKR